MPPNSKCIYWSRTENVSGRPTQLTIMKHDQKTIEIVVNYAPESTFSRRNVMLFLIVLLNFISLIFELVRINYCIAVMAIVVFVVYSTAFAIKEESVLIVQPLGYQIERRYALGQTIRFIAWEHIKSIFINEVVSKQRVIFILALLTKDTTKEPSAIIPLFTEIMPRLQCLEIIYQHIENCH